MDVLRGEVIRYGVRTMERVMVAHLLLSDEGRSTQERVTGAFGFDIRTGKFYVFKAKTVVVAAGGAALKRVSKGLSAPCPGKPVYLLT